MHEEELIAEIKKLGLKEHDVVLMTIKNGMSVYDIKSLQIALKAAIDKTGLEKISYIITTGMGDNLLEINNYDVIKMFKTGWLKLDPAVFALLVEAELMTCEEMNNLKSVLQRIVDNNGKHGGK